MTNTTTDLSAARALTTIARVAAMQDPGEMFWLNMTGQVDLAALTDLEPLPAQYAVMIERVLIKMGGEDYGHAGYVGTLPGGDELHAWWASDIRDGAAERLGTDPAHISIATLAPADRVVSSVPPLRGVAAL